MRNELFFTFFILSTFLSRQLAAQSRADSSLTQNPITGTMTFSRLVSRTDTVVQLPHEFLLEGSEKVLLESLELSKPSDYVIHYRTGRLMLERRVLPATLSRLVVSYRLLPLPPKNSYFKHRLVMRSDTNGSTPTIVSPATPFSPDELFGQGLQKSGSIFRGLSVGSNRDLSLSSGFRLQLSGKLSDDVDVVAALTDENSPIQPEGTTQTLQEVDKVFVELTHPSYTATLGDFTIERSSSQPSEFGKFFRKVQGARGVAHWEAGALSLNRSMVSLTAAAARGKYHNNQFQGIEGSQGPYRLTGKNGERRIIIVAGSERVYLNGELMTRGETNDYIIDYASAEVHFTPKRLITNASRISIDFEYTDRQYARNLLVGSADVEMADRRVGISALVVQEADDPDSPIDVALDEHSRSILRASGADRFTASISGVRFVGRDSTGAKGQYVLRDTTLNGRHYAILIYAPGDSLALYSATFSPVDNMPPDSAGYERIAVGQFRFAGIGKGNYLPIQFLPMPQQHRFADVVASVAPYSNVQITMEYAASSFDRNRFSTLDDIGTSGGAFALNARFKEKDLSLGGSRVGSVELSLKKRFVDRRFVAPDRFNEVEFGRKWDVNLSQPTDENLQEARLSYQPTDGIVLAGTYGTLEQKGVAQSTRTEAAVEMKEERYPALTFNLEKIESRNHNENTRASWLRQRGDIHHALGIVVPGLRVEHEDRNLTSAESDSSHAGSFRFLEYAPRLQVLPWGVFQASAEFQFRSEDSALAGRRGRALQVTTQRYSVMVREWNAITSTLDMSIRRGRVTEPFRLRGSSNSEIILVRSLTRYNPFQRHVEGEAFYEFSSQRSARQERVFIRVARGSGNYRYKGDLNGNNAPDDDEFELTRFDGDYIVVFVPGDRLYPVVDLKSALRVRLNGDRLFSEDGSIVAAVVRSLSTETTLRVDERSSDPITRHIYLLQLHTFQNPQTTIVGSHQIQQDLHVFERSPDLSFRFRYNQRRGMVQLIASTERSQLTEQSVRIRSQLLPEIGNVTEYVHRFDRVTATVPTGRERDLLGDALSTDFSYRPLPRWEVGFRFDVSRTVDRFNTSGATADVNEQSLRLVYAFVGVGQLRAEIEREEVITSNVPVGKILPYEFTGGRIVGKTFLWQVAFDYRIAQNIQVTVNYNGRSEGGRLPIHNARAEARAFF